MIFCKFCGKSCKPLGLFSHERLCKNNPNHNIKNHPSFGRKGTNQFVKAKESGVILKMPTFVKEKISNSSKAKNWSDSRKLSHSLVMQEVVKNNPESYSSHNVNGRVKKIRYKDILLDGSWEVLFASWCDANNIKWLKNTNFFNYYWKDKPHIYYPDFYLPEFNVYIEIKGYETDRDRCKWNVLTNLIVLKNKEIRRIQVGQFTRIDLLNS